MEDVILRDEADPVFLAVGAGPVEGPRAFRRRADACQRGEQGALPGTAGPDHCGQSSGLDGETDVVEPDGSVAVWQGQVARPDPRATNGCLWLRCDGVHGVFSWARRHGTG